METTIGAIGLRIPVQSLTSSDKLEMTPTAVMAWRNRLPMADTGATANKVYHALHDCNMVTLSPRDRFQILELFRTPVQFICQSLRKHYLNQNAALTDKKLMIVQLAQTLQLEMANGYKIIVEQVAKSGGEDRKTLLPQSIEQILHYFNHVLLRSYHLYSSPPQELWKEFYLLYQFAERENLDEGEVLIAFKHALIMAATDPYKWRQSELDALFNASQIWTKDVSIRTGSQNKVPGQYLFELTQDRPPYSPTTSQIQDPKNCRILDVVQLVAHLKTLLTIVEPDELHARMEHSYDPEYALSLPVLHGIIQEWETIQKRTSERLEKTEHVRVCIGLSAVHYYLNKERPFQPEAISPAGAEISEVSVERGQLELKNEAAENNKANEVITVQFESTEKATAFPTYEAEFPIYPAIELNESDEGRCLVWHGDIYPPIQAGELLGIEITSATGKNWLVAMVRWLKHFSPTELRLGMRILAKETMIAAAAQIIKEGKEAGYYLRCLILDSGILTPTIPFKVGSQILIAKADGVTEEVELLKLRSATGSYKLFDYVKSKDANEQAIITPKEAKEQKDQGLHKGHKPKGTDPFDSIWTHL